MLSACAGSCRAGSTAAFHPSRTLAPAYSSDRRTNPALSIATMAERRFQRPSASLALKRHRYSVGSSSNARQRTERMVSALKLTGPATCGAAWRASVSSAPEGPLSASGAVAASARVSKSIMGAGSNIGRVNAMSAFASPRNPFPRLGECPGHAGRRQRRLLEY